MRALSVRNHLLLTGEAKGKFCLTNFRSGLFRFGSDLETSPHCSLDLGY